MAQVDRRVKKAVPQTNGNNRMTPKLQGALKEPPEYHNTYGVTPGKDTKGGGGGAGVPAKNQGNRCTPKLAGALKMPTSHDSYSGGPDNK